MRTRCESTRRHLSDVIFNATKVLVVVLVSAAWMYPVLVAKQSSSAAENDSALTLVGELPVATSTPLLAEMQTKRILALADTRIEAYDPNTLKKTATLQLAPYRMVSPVVYAWGPNQRMLYLLIYAPLAGGVDDLNQTTPYLATIDPVALKTLSVQRTTPFPTGIRAGGMSYDPSEDRLYVVGQDFQGLGLLGDHSVHLTALDAKTGALAPGWAQAFALGASCQKLVATSFQSAVHRAPGSNKVFVPCGTGNLILSRQPGVPGVVGVDISNPAAPTTKTHPIAGSYAAGNSLYDPVSSRMIVLSAGANVPSQSAWVFDEVNEVVIGVLNAGDINIVAAGIDPIGGRLYVGIDQAILSTAYLGDRIGQATSTPMARVVASTITVIPFAKRVVFARQLADSTTHVYVYESKLPDYNAPQVVDVDAGTVDVAEAPGKTGVNFGGDGKAFGARVHQVAGINGVLQNVAVRTGDYWVILQGGKTGLNDGDRVITFARTIAGRLADGEASGQGVNTDGDANTRSDYRVLTQPTPPDPRVPAPPPPPGGSWPYKPATCSDLGGGKQNVTASESSASCDLVKQVVDVQTAHENSNAVPGLSGDATQAIVSFGSSTSSTKLTRDPKQGLVVESKAESRDVNIGGVVSIGRITSVARSSAAGRPKTTTASYERVFEDVVTPTGSCSNDCHPQAVVDQINLALGPKFSAELPLPKLMASPKGRLGLALRNPWQHRQDVVLNNAAETDLEIPALRIVYVNDNASRSRVLFDFAATMANSSYSIYLVDSDSFDSDGSDDDFSLAEQFAGASLGDGEEFTDESVSGVVPDDTLLGGGGGGSGGSAQLTGTSSLGRRLGHGLRLLLTGRRAFLLNALLWSLLSAPVFVIGRRRYLLRLIGSYR